MRFSAKLRPRTPRQIARCKSLLRVLYRHATIDAVLSQACERLERALIDECNKKGLDWRKKLDAETSSVPDIDAETSSRRPLISE